MKFILLIFLAIVGCKSEVDKVGSMLDYSCTPDQMKIVESQTTFCTKQTAYTSAFCYVAAMKRNCAGVKDEQTR